MTPGFRKDYQELLRSSGSRMRSPVAEWLREVYQEITSAREVALFNRLYRTIRHPETLPGGWGLPGDWAPPEHEDREVARFLRSVWLNVAFTARGLELLAGGLAGFPRAFTEGLFHRTTGVPEDAFIFGKKANWKVRDSLQSRPAQTPAASAADAQKVVHAVLIVGADSEDDLKVEVRRQRERLDKLELQSRCASAGRRSRTAASTSGSETGSRSRTRKPAGRLDPP